MCLILEHTLAQIRDFCNLSTEVLDYSDSFTHKSCSASQYHMCVRSLLGRWY